MEVEYTGKYWTMFSEKYGEEVHILEYKSKGKTGKKWCWEYCSECGKPLIRTWYVVQSAETDVEMEYLGSDCIKHFK